MNDTAQYFKSVRPDGTTRNGLDWNVPTGTVIRVDHAVADDDDGHVCPTHEGDGITIAKTWRGAALAGWSTQRCCTVTVDPADVLAEDSDKMRVRAVTVGEWYDAVGLLRRGFGAGADLARANLTRANLAGADLAGADLAGANLAGAYLGLWERGPAGYARKRTTA